jgi:uncharacterized protein YgiB involved in biofilm formation
MSRRPRKSSACVTLVLIGAAALAGCGDTPLSRRASYATKDACLADWGDPKECEEQPRGSSSSTRSWGPSSSTWHSYSSRSRGSSSSSSSSSHSISRGGFGSHGSSAS